MGTAQTVISERELVCHQDETDLIIRETIEE